MNSKLKAKTGGHKEMLSIWADQKRPRIKTIDYREKRQNKGVRTVKNAVELLGAFRPDVEQIQYH